MASVGRELLQAVSDCRIRGLLVPAKWAAAALCGLPEEGVAAAAAHPSSVGCPTPGPAFELARSFFDLKVRAASSLRVSDRTAARMRAARFPTVA